jgi:hypothetical protein
MHASTSTPARGDWTGWYYRNIPLADDLYDQHLRNLDDEEG